MENINFDTVVTYAGYLVAVLTAAISLYRSHKAGQTLAQSLVIMANTLKDEAKMPDGMFSTATIQKAKEVATTIGANDVAVEEVKKALQGKELDVKIGSLKGKPIYLSDAIGIGSVVQGFGKLFGR